MRNWKLLDVEFKWNPYHRLAATSLFFALALALPSCALSSTQGEDSRPNQPQLEVASAQSLYAHAEEKAGNWQEDPRLQQVSMSVYHVEDNKPLRAWFTYRSESVPDNYLLLTITIHQSYIETESNHGEYTFPRPLGEPIELDGIEIDSMAALEIALQKGGVNFLNRNPSGRWSMSLDLMYTDLYASTGPLVWRALFSSDPVGTRYIRVDPETGEVISTKDNPPRTQ